MKYIPILFSTPMVQAILEGRKTVTRRVANVPNHDHFGTNIMDWGLSKHPHLHEGKWKYRVQTDVDDSATHELKEKAIIGDILWVRETHYAFGCWKRTGDRTKGGKDEWEFVDKTLENGANYHFEVNDDLSKISIHTIRDGEDRWYKRPSIFMPKAACRIFLQVTDVKVERLQDIGETDVKREGAGEEVRQMWLYGSDQRGRDEIYRRSFESLWQKINGKESWEANPFCWVISFIRVDRPDDF